MAAQALSTGVSIVLLCALLLACVRIVRARIVEAFIGPIYLEYDRSKESDGCERRAHDASSILFVVTRTRRKVEPVLHSVLYWTVFLDDLFYK